MSKSTTASFDGLTKQQREVLMAAAGLYSRHVEELGKRALELGKGPDASAYENEAKGIKEDLVLKLEEEVPQLRVHEVKALEKGLAFFLKNLRAAKGTVRGLGKADLADTFEEEALEIEKELVPQFAEQVAMKGM